MGVSPYEFKSRPRHHNPKRGSGSAVEHLLAKEKVAGSNPVFRSTPGDVAKWQGGGLQNLYQRFESARRLHHVVWAPPAGAVPALPKWRNGRRASLKKR